MSVSTEKIPGVAFLPFPDAGENLADELKNRLNFSGEISDLGGFLYAPSWSGEKFPFWSKCTAKNLYRMNFSSIGEAASELKKIQRSWAHFGSVCFRRSALIQEKLPYVNLKPRKFPFEIPQSPMGIFTLLDEHTMIFSAETTSFMPCGEISFVEDHENPPSRAYLKLQESLLLSRRIFGCDLPDENSRCFDAGACPGGWTFVLATLGAKIFAVDRSPLAPELMKNPLVEFFAHDAFTLSPDELGDFDWIFSDVICYPRRLLSWIRMWIQSGKCRRMICTIKMQGETDWSVISEFEKIPCSRVVHLNYNKHELTFLHVE
jgi:23S rRNA (cytidine2498-2'-O)-methyltransferase